MLRLIALAVIAGFLGFLWTLVDATSSVCWPAWIALLVLVALDVVLAALARKDKNDSQGANEPLVWLVILAPLAIGTAVCGLGPPRGGNSSAIDGSIVADMPPSEEAFCEAHRRARTRYTQAGGDLVRSWAIPDRQADVEAALGTEGGFQEWVGTLSATSTTGAGRLVVTVELPCEVTIGTVNGALSEALSRSTLDHTDPMFARISGMEVGSIVRVSGRLVRERQGDAGPFWELSAAAAESVEHPHWIVEFAEVVGPPVAAVLPASELAFCEANTKTREAYAAAANDLVRSRLAKERQKAIAAAMGPKDSFSDWVATLEKLTTTGDGRAVVEIKLSCGVVVGTQNNDFSDALSLTRTTIAPDTPLYQQLEHMTAGQSVIVSGSMVRTRRGGDFDDMSLTERGSVNDPKWLAKFSEIRPAP